MSGLLAFAMAASACTSDESPQTVETFCADYAKRECEAKAPICVQEVASCVSIRTNSCVAFIAPLQAGTRQFKRDNANACLTKVSEIFAKAIITADDFNVLRTTCGRVVEGTAAANQGCVADQDCQTPLVCDKGRCGTLRIVPAGGNCANPGERCTPDESCQPNGPLYICTPNQSAGAVCGPTQPCTSSLRCEGTCMPKLPIGSACMSDEMCAMGFCDPYNPTGTPRTCLPGLAFAPNSPSCFAFFGPRTTGPSPDAATPVDTASAPDTTPGDTGTVADAAGN